MAPKIKILAVDDEEFYLDIMIEYLEAAGYEVIAADDGDTALQKLEEHPDVAVVVLDRMMPRMNGMDVLKKILADPRFRAIPVILQTAAATPVQVMEGVQAGAYAYISKPYEDNELLSIVANAYNSKKQQ